MLSVKIFHRSFNWDLTYFGVKTNYFSLMHKYFLFPAWVISTSRVSCCKSTNSFGHRKQKWLFFLLMKLKVFSADAFILFLTGFLWPSLTVIKPWCESVLTGLKTASFRILCSWTEDADAGFVSFSQRCCMRCVHGAQKGREECFCLFFIYFFSILNIMID